MDDVGALRSHAEAILRSWGRFRVASDPDSADLVFQLLPFSSPTGSADERLQHAQIQVWPRDSNHRTVDPVWVETYFAKWPQSDAVSGVIKLLRKDIEDCEKSSGS
jgi:hypothetical protein